MTGERSTNNFGRRGAYEEEKREEEEEEEKEKEEETVPSLREGRGLAAFPGPASQRRAEISGNRLTIFLVRAHVAAPGDPWTRSTSADAQPTPQGRSRSTPRGRRGAPHTAQEAPNRGKIVPRRSRRSPDGPRG
ncbi:unnamed protein product [Prorocentrum cordatum]|uniref:Uncharacterized protein n=1 Tax=Prorocentrum cordatum TaxID=2364126 RepID=A0ABN9S7Y2_9DINO|nr:unnamed protein product [Polarella glacialis]